MKPRDCVFLLPSYELDGYPRHLPAEGADSLLSGWLALWDPRLLAVTQLAPRWQQATQLPQSLEGIVFILPSISKEELSLESEHRIRDEGGLLLRPQAPWRDFQQHLLSSLDLPEESSLCAELRVNFAALGYAYLQIQLMTRQLRYTSNLDSLQFGAQVAEGATAAVAGDRETALRMLQACFDTLGQERDHYYSLDVNLLDVTLLAPTTLGKSLTKQLAQRHPSTYLASGEIIEQLQRQDRDLNRTLIQATQERIACLAGGFARERAHPLMNREAVARDLLRGREAYLRNEHEVPRVFGRLSFGFYPDSAALLRRCGFDGGFLIAWSSGVYPEGSQAKFSWEASDGTFLPALNAPILDASSPASFLSLGWTVGESLDHQHVPTLILAHWPNQSCDYLELLRIVAAQTPALGKWRLAGDYFSETDQPYHQERLSETGFRYNWLIQTDNPAALVSATKDFHRVQIRCRSLQNLCNLVWQLENFHKLATPLAPQLSTAQAESENHAMVADDEQHRSTSTPAPTPLNGPDPAANTLPLTTWEPDLARLIDLADGLLDDPPAAAETTHQALRLADDLADRVLLRLSRQLVKPSKTSQHMSQAASSKSRLLFNARSCPARIRSFSPANQFLSGNEKMIYASGRAGEHRVTAVDIPSLGFVIAPLSQSSDGKAPKERTLAQAGGFLCNEFLETQIDTSRGHLRSLHIPAKRGNRLSLMIARRDRLPDGKYAYSEMVARDVKMLTSSNMCGVVRSTGHLEMNGKPMGEFEIDYEVWRGSRIVEVHVRLSKLAPLSDLNPWRSAYIARMAWPTEAALLRTFSCGSRHPWPSGRAVSPLLIEIDEADYRTHILTGGLAFHRRTETRFLETVLAVQGESSAAHRLGIGVDLPHPLLAASEFVDRTYQLELAEEVLPTNPSGWLATADTRNVVLDCESPLVDAQGRLVGLRLFLTETDGKSTNAKIRLLREIESANRVDYLGGRIGKLTTEGDRLTIAMRSNEQVNVDVIWKR